MALQMKTQIYEVLVRFDGGKFQGAHSRSLETIYDDADGSVVTARELGAEPVTAAQLEQLLTADTADMVSACATQVAMLQEQGQQLEAAQAQIADLQAQLEQAQAAAAPARDGAGQPDSGDVDATPAPSPPPTEPDQAAQG